MSARDPYDQATYFSRAWKQYFGETPPLGHVLRHDYFDRWTRFHALPESKRYADTDAERNTIICRANALANKCFGEHAPVWLVAGCSSGFDLEDNDLPVRMSMSPSMTWIDEEEEPNDQSEITFFAALVAWESNSLDMLFGEIAEDRERAILFSEREQTVLAPYDGGFDIVSLLPDRIGEIEDKHRAWMSNRPDKL